jgi:hypothetical protein
MELNRFRQLLESTMGNVKPLIYEQDTTQSGSTIVTVKSPSDIPQSLIEGEAPLCTFYPGGRNPWGDLKDMSRGITGGYTFRVPYTKSTGYNLQGVEGYLEAMTNDFLLTEQEAPGGGFTVALFDEDRVPASEVVKNSNEKWIGFTSKDNRIRFACLNQTNGQFGCRNYVWVKKEK